MLQVEYTMTPFTLQQSIAERINYFCICEFLYMSIRRRLAFMEGSLAMIPNPVHGASSKTLSNPPGNISAYFLPSLQVTHTFCTPILYKLNCKAFSLYFFRSLANMQPVFFISWAIWVVLPPGALAKSNILSCGCGSSAITGSRDDADCNI